MPGETAQLQRSLTARHLSMIAIGGSIGTGLFVASGGSIAAAGPGGALAAYALIGTMVYFLMTSLGELAAYLPVSGAFSTYATRFVEPGFGFAIGWNYWYNWAITIAVELVASGIIMRYWFPNTSPVVWSALFLSVILGFNLLSVKGFGESEYWCSLLKVITVLGFLVIGTIRLFNQNFGTPLGVLQNFFIEEAPFVGGWKGWFSVMMIAAFSFQGTELVGMAAAESNAPASTIPKAIRQIFWRILLFYILSLFLIGALLPYTTPELLNSEVSSIGASPFTLVFRSVGIPFAADFMNLIILSAVLSAGNSGMYASSRMLYSMAKNGMAPTCFAKLSSRGIPLHALALTTLVAMLCFFTTRFEDQTVYFWLLNASGMAGFIAWLGIAIAHYRFRKGYVQQGHALAALPYRARWFPLGPLLAIGLCLCVVLGQEFELFTSTGSFSWGRCFATYFGIPLFLMLWIGYRWFHKSTWISYASMDFGIPKRNTDASSKALARNDRIALTASAQEKAD